MAFDKLYMYVCVCIDVEKMKERNRNNDEWCGKNDVVVNERLVLKM